MRRSSSRRKEQAKRETGEERQNAPTEDPDPNIGKEDRERERGGPMISAQRDQSDNLQAEKEMQRMGGKKDRVREMHELNVSFIRKDKGNRYKAFTSV